MMSKTKTVGIIVVNWNSGELTLKAIAPYLQYVDEQISCEIVVVDNGSTDNSGELLRQQPVTLILNENNTGFGHACNQAFTKLNCNYILLLNPDTESNVHTLKELVDYLDKNPQVAVTGPMQKNASGNVLRCCGRFPSFSTAMYEVLGISKKFPQFFKPAPLMIDYHHLNSCQVDHIMGSYMLIRKNILDKIGFMDSDYFVYWEDIDLSKRIANIGFKSYYNAEVAITHQGGGSGHSITGTRLYYSFSARRTYWKKHLGKLPAMVLIFFSLTIEPLVRILTKPASIKTILKAYGMYIRLLKD